MRFVLCVALLFAIAVSSSSCSSSSSAAELPAVLGEFFIPSQAYALTRLESGLTVFLTDVGTGPEPWVTDGTDAGTFQLAETFVGILPGSTISQGGVDRPDGGPTYIVRGDEAFFLAVPGALWKTNGTIDGTSLVLDLAPDGYYFEIGSTMLDDDELSIAGCLFLIADGTPGDCKVIAVSLGS